MEAVRHSLMGDKIQVFRRPTSSYWQASCSVAGRQRKFSTREESLARAKDVACDWYLSLMGKYRGGEIREGKTFREAAERFIDEFEVVTKGERSEIYVANHRRRITNHLIPYFGDTLLQDITSGVAQEYRVHRIKNGRAKSQPVEAKEGTAQQKPPTRSTLHQEFVCLRQILKFAERNRWINHIPNLAPPYRGKTKVSHRAWFSPEEYKQLYQATRERAKNPKRERWRTASETLHDTVLFLVNTGLRPDEALRLQFRDVAIVADEATGERILEIEVKQGKRGVGYCKSMPGAVIPFERIVKRRNPKPDERVFPSLQGVLFNNILAELNLKTDREGQTRSAYSLRHTYICLRLMEGADIYQIAKNCRTSVEMIETYYASHIKNMLDTSAINVMRPKSPNAKGGKGKRPPRRS